MMNIFLEPQVSDVVMWNPESTMSFSLHILIHGGCLWCKSLKIIESSGKIKTENGFTDTDFNFIKYLLYISGIPLYTLVSLSVIMGNNDDATTTAKIRVADYDEIKKISEKEDRTIVAVIHRLVENYMKINSMKD